jgi:hypothetical protein
LEQDSSFGVVVQLPVPEPVQQASGAPAAVQAELGKLLNTLTVMVKPVTPEDKLKTLSMEPLLLFGGVPPVATEVSVPPVTVPTVSCSWVLTALFEFTGRTVWRVVVPL